MGRQKQHKGRKTSREKSLLARERNRRQHGGQNTNVSNCTVLFVKVT